MRMLLQHRLREEGGEVAALMQRSEAAELAAAAAGRRAAAAEAEVDKLKVGGGCGWAVGCC